MTTRRAFLGWLAAAVPVAGFIRRAHALAVDHIADDTRTLRAVGEAVLPSELGAANQRAVVEHFQQWIAGYREQAELLHGYGTSALEFAGPTPATRWAAQLAALDTTARHQHNKEFAALGLADRRSILTTELDAMKNARLGNVGRAPHVALAVLSHFYASADATDLCYESRIGKQTCRPLAASSRKPLPLHGSRT